MPMFTSVITISILTPIMFIVSPNGITAIDNRAGIIAIAGDKINKSLLAFAGIMSSFVINFSPSAIG